MTTKDQLVALNESQLTIAENGEVIDSGPITDFDSIEADVDIAVTTKVPEALIVYLLDVDAQLNVAVRYDSGVPLPAGSDLRIPSEGYFKTTTDGTLAVVGCAHAVAPSEWPTLLGDGHDGDVKTGSTVKP